MDTSNGVIENYSYVAEDNRLMEKTCYEKNTVKENRPILLSCLEYCLVNNIHDDHDSCYSQIIEIILQNNPNLMCMVSNDVIYKCSYLLRHKSIKILVKHNKYWFPQERFCEILNENEIANI